MQEDKTTDSEKVIQRNPYDVSSDEDEDNTPPVLPSLLKKLKLLTLAKPWEAHSSIRKTQALI